jgi:large subunit ribosomal protein L35Ae
MSQVAENKTATQTAPKATASKKIKKGTGQPVRLWVRAKFLGFRRSKVQQNENQAILQLQGVNDRSAAQWYFGKRVVYVFKSSSSKANRFKTIWGRIATTHGNNGKVLARFATNLPPRAIGSTLRVMLFPQRHQ